MKKATASGDRSERAAARRRGSGGSGGGRRAGSGGGNDAPSGGRGGGRTAAIVDFGRSPDFGHTLTFGLVADWNVDLDFSPEKEGTVDAVAHHVAPFTVAMAEARYEAANGLTAAALRVEGGGAWNSDTGWGGVFTSSARLERTVLAFNDHPLSLHLGGSYDAARGEWLGEAGLSFALFQRRDPRVNLE